MNDPDAVVDVAGEFGGPATSEEFHVAAVAELRRKLADIDGIKAHSEWWQLFMIRVIAFNCAVESQNLLPLIHGHFPTEVPRETDY